MRWQRIANPVETINFKRMNASINLPNVGEELHRKLARRAAANHRTVEAEALCCLREAIEMDETLMDSVPQGEWVEIEQSVCETIHDRGTPLTDADFQRYRELARGRNRS